MYRIDRFKSINRQINNTCKEVNMDRYIVRQIDKWIENVIRVSKAKRYKL